MIPSCHPKFRRFPNFIHRSFGSKGKSSSKAFKGTSTPTFSSVKSESSRKWLQRQHKDEFSLRRNSAKRQNTRRNKGGINNNQVVGGIVGGGGMMSSTPDLRAPSSRASPRSLSSNLPTSTHFLHQVSRASHKLEDILKSHRYSDIGNVLDLGCAPGGWMEYHSHRVFESLGAEIESSKICKTPTTIVGVDLLDCKVGTYGLALNGRHGGHRAQVLKGDFTDASTLDEIWDLSLGSGYGMITSDVSPNRTGDKNLDSVRQNELSLSALSVADEMMMRGKGVVVVKFSRGEGWTEVDEFGKKIFKTWRIVKPKASRGESREGFFVGEHKI